MYELTFNMFYPALVTCFLYSIVLGAEHDIYINDGINAVFNSIEKKMRSQCEQFKTGILSEAKRNQQCSGLISMSDDPSITHVQDVREEIDILKQAINDYSLKKELMIKRIMTFLQQKITVTEQDYNQVRNLTLEINRLLSKVEHLHEIVANITSDGEGTVMTEPPFDPDLDPPGNITAHRTSTTKMRVQWDIQYPVVRGYIFYFIRRDFEHHHINHWTTFDILNHSKQVDVDGLLSHLEYALRMRAVSMEGVNGVLSGTLYVKRFHE